MCVHIFDPIISLLGIYPTHIFTCMCIGMCIVLFVIINNWKPFECSSIVEWLNNLWYINTMEYYTVIQNNRKLYIKMESFPRHLRMK